MHVESVAQQHVNNPMHGPRIWRYHFWRSMSACQIFVLSLIFDSPHQYLNTSMFTDRSDAKPLVLLTKITAVSARSSQKHNDKSSA